MDPISIGFAAAVLLASKFGETIAADAGESTWTAVKRLHAAILAKFHDDPESETSVAALIADPAPTTQAQVARLIDEAAREDAEFGSELVQLIAEARQNETINRAVVQSFDQSKQTVFLGDNKGQITIL
ncbi:hypothetical protein [Nocardia tengchongensis]|uniref:hypothetical protein n=1 Tax=Nocardia tengchongensis TaxID=2055889 RepID=UPI003612A5FC